MSNCLSWRIKMMIRNANNILKNMTKIEELIKRLQKSQKEITPKKPKKAKKSRSKNKAA